MKVKVSSEDHSSRRGRLWFGVLTVAAFAVGFWIVNARWQSIATVASSSRGLHSPDVSLLLAQSPLVITHVMAALTAVVLGGLMMLSAKGATFHRSAGWAWATLMGFVAISSLLITGRDGEYSMIHFMSISTLIVLPVALHSARRHATKRHGALMKWLFYVMLIGAFAFTLVPGRLMWKLLFA